MGQKISKSPDLGRALWAVIFKIIPKIGPFKSNCFQDAKPGYRNPLPEKRKTQLWTSNRAYLRDLKTNKLQLANMDFRYRQAHDSGRVTGSQMKTMPSCWTS